MNERIQELLAQAYKEASVPGPIEDKVTVQEKFAELIVRECVCLVLNGKYDEEKFKADDDFHRGHNTALDFTAEGLKQYFGVDP